MKLLLKNNEKSTQVMLVAESEDDYRVIDYLYHQDVIFGGYLLYTHKPDSNSNSQYKKFFDKHLPTAKGCLIINVVNGFVNEKDKKIEA